MASLRFKKDGTPYVDFRAQGGRYRPEFLSLKDAKKFLTLADADPVSAYELWQESIGAPVAKASFREKAEAFRDDYCSRRANKNDMTRIMNLLIEFVGDVPLSEVPLETYVAFQTKLATSGVENSTVNRYMTTVKTFVKRMFLAGCIQVNYAGLIESLVAEAPVKREAWRDDDTPKLVAVLSEKKADPVLIEIARSMEFAPFGPIDFKRLTWQMVNFEIGEIQTFRMKGKGKRAWNVPMILGYQKLLLEIRRRSEAAGLGKPSDPVYLTADFNPINTTWVSKSLERARKAAGIDRVPYSSRHRIISRLAEKTNRDTASRFAGHASLRTTEKHYLVGGDEEFREKVKEAFAE